MKLLLIFLGGGLGSLTRHALSLINTPTLPYGTLASNALSCFLLGILTAAYLSRPDSHHAVRWLLATGFCGGFSTFSTYIAENYQIWNNRLPITTIFYLLGSIVIGWLFLALGIGVWNRYLSHLLP